MGGRKIIELINEPHEERLDGSGAVARPHVSLEYFPPRTEEGIEILRKKISNIKAIPPAFVDFTWGAGGSTSATTLKLAIEAQTRLGLEVNMHLTCTNMNPEKVKQALDSAKAAGIRNIFALRGDPPNMTGEYIRKEYGDYFNICVAGYPEGHPDRTKVVSGGMDSLSDAEKSRCRITTGPNGEDLVEVCSDKDFDIELAYLKQKVDAGADCIITQMFFDINQFLNFVKACRAVNINAPIIPGIMCIINYRSFIKMTDFCKTRVPEPLMAKMSSVKEDNTAVKALAIEFGCNLCRELMKQRVPGLHFYTLNSIRVPMGILQELGLQGAYSTLHNGNLK